MDFHVNHETGRAAKGPFDVKGDTVDGKKPYYIVANWEGVLPVPTDVTYHNSNWRYHQNIRLILVPERMALEWVNAKVGASPRDPLAVNECPACGAGDCTPATCPANPEAVGGNI